MMDAVHRYEGYVAQSRGDGIFALFGLPSRIMRITLSDVRLDRVTRTWLGPGEKELPPEEQILPAALLGSSSRAGVVLCSVSIRVVSRLSFYFGLHKARH
jgi:hypothetical protein